MPEPPVDPGYIAFRDGLLESIHDEGDRQRRRWSPYHQKWGGYPASDWVLDDVGLGDTSPGSLFPDYYHHASSEESKRRWADGVLPPVFANVTAKYQQYKARWPGLVWTWRDHGDWRNVLPRNPGGPDEPGTPGRPGPIPEHCQRRIDDVNAYLAAGHITAAQAQKMIAKIIEECVGVPGDAE